MQWHATWGRNIKGDIRGNGATYFLWNGLDWVGPVNTDIWRDGIETVSSCSGHSGCLYYFAVKKNVSPHTSPLICFKFSDYTVSVTTCFSFLKFIYMFESTNTYATFFRICSPVTCTVRRTLAVLWCLDMGQWRHFMERPCPTDSVTPLPTGVLFASDGTVTKNKNRESKPSQQ
jgi:hypothetical protein